MIKLLVTLSLLLLSCIANADETNGILKYGVGLNTADNHPTITQKIISVGYQHSAFAFFDYQLEGGGFFDTNVDSQNASAFFGPSIGISVVENWYYLKVFSGIIGLTDTDSRLGGNLEFNHDLQVGLKDGRGVGIGLTYKHMSSAGIFQPNLGRDWLMLQLNFPF